MDKAAKEEERRKDATLALMVYEVFLLNGSQAEAVPSKRLRKWCNRVLGRELDWTAR